MERYAHLWHTTRYMLRREATLEGGKSGNNVVWATTATRSRTVVWERTSRLGGVCVSGQPVEDTSEWYTGLSRTGDYLTKSCRQGPGVCFFTFHEAGAYCN